MAAKILSMVFKVIICFAYDTGRLAVGVSWNVSTSLQPSRSIAFTEIRVNSQSLLKELVEQSTINIRNEAHSKMENNLSQLVTTASYGRSMGLTSLHFKVNASLSAHLQVSSTLNISSCTRCTSATQNDKSFLYLMLGIGIGSAFLIFIMSLVIVARVRWKRRITSESRRSVEQDDNFMSKESIFNSSTLQLHSGLNNDGLELDAYSKPDSSRQSSKCLALESGQKQIYIDAQQESYIAVESYSKDISSTLDKVTKYDVSIRLLEDWCEDLNNRNTKTYRELRDNIEKSIRCIYKEKEEFSNVYIKGFRNGSIIVDLILIMLAAICNPLDVLERSVHEGVVGSLQVDPLFPLVSNEATGENRNADNDATSALNKMSTTRKSIGSSLTDRQEFLSCDSGIGINMKERPMSLDDVRVPQLSAGARDVRDSGIGSMPELNSSESKLCKSEVSVFDDILESTDGSQEGSSAVHTVAQVSPPKTADVAHVVLYHFSGESDRELSVSQGEVVYIINKGSSGWVKVRNSADQSGWLPVSFLVHVSRTQLVDTQETVETLEFFDNILEQLDNDSGSSVSSASSPESECSPERECSLESECSPERECSLESECSPQRKEPTDEVYLGKNKSSKPEDNLRINVKHCKSVYKFDGEDPSEMSFAEGELIQVLKTSKAGWWKGQTKDRIGWFPSSFVMPLNEASELSIGSNVSVSSKASRDDRRNTYSDPGTRTRVRPSIYDLQNLTRTDQSHQSLQRGSRARKDYADLYVQILKRESNENIPKSCSLSSLQTYPGETSLDRPLRVPPSPPKEDALFSQNTEDMESRKSAGFIVKKARSFEEGPPKRTVPLPPTPKLHLAPFSLMRANSSVKVAPPLRTRHELSQETPRKPADFERKKSLQVALSNAELAEDLEDS